MYQTIPARILNQTTNSSNEITESGVGGFKSQDLRKVLLYPNQPLCQLIEGDFLQIPWGTKPNTFCPPGVPSSAGPCIYLMTPTGEVKLTWNGTQYQSTNPNHTLSITGGVWCLVGPAVNFCFNTGNFFCQEFPTGYSLIRSSGDSKDYRIVKITEENDHLGRICHYSVTISLVDGTEGLPVQ